MIAWAGLERIEAGLVHGDGDLATATVQPRWPLDPNTQQPALQHFPEKSARKRRLGGISHKSTVHKSHT